MARPKQVLQTSSNSVANAKKFPNSFQTAAAHVKKELHEDQSSFARLLLIRTEKGLHEP